MSTQSPFFSALNRAWRSLIGTGIVRTDGDFGTQSDPPSHPQLLDWLAVEWMQSGWSIKHLHRMIVNSATYQQSSVLTQQASKDPDNVWLSRANRSHIARRPRTNNYHIKTVCHEKTPGT